MRSVSKKKRDKEAKEGIKGYLVKVPTTEMPTLKAIAAAARSGAPLYSAVRAVAAKALWQEFVNSVLDAPRPESSAASDEELIALLAAVVADPLLQEIVRAVMAAPELAGLLVEITRRDGLRGLVETVASDVELFAAVAALAANGALQEIVRSMMTVPGLADLLLRISRHDWLRKLTEALSENAVRGDAVSELIKADDTLLRALLVIVRTANRAATDRHTSSVVAEALSVALQDPEAVARTFAIRQAGGFRARMLNWLLRVG